MRKDFPLHSELNRFIERAVENGLIVKWSKKKIFRSVKEKAPEVHFIEITLEMYLILDLICVGMLATAGIALIFERVVYKRARLRGAARLWRYIDMMFDSNRYFLLNDRSY